MAKQKINATKSQVRAALAKFASTVLVMGQGCSAKPKDFSTGSQGLNLTGRIFIDLGGDIGLVPAQVSGNVVIHGSADLPEGE